MGFSGEEQSTVARPLAYCRRGSWEVAEEKTRGRGSTPSSVKKPTQNWWVDQRFRTRGIPIRSSARDGRLSGPGAAERVLPNHLGNVRVVTLGLLELRLHLAQLVHVLDQTLPPRLSPDHPLPARGQRQLAPRPALGPGQGHVDEGTRAVDRAPLADGVRGGGARIGQRRERTQAPGPAPPAAPRPAPVGRAEGRAEAPPPAPVPGEDPLGPPPLPTD